ncbi:unnamed protein product [Rotaria sp. Silwood1]|nr:unnamed protein product [Rotaria sp. Silwood1]
MDYLLKYDVEIKPKEKFILFNVNGHKIMIPMDKKIAPIDIPVKLRNSMKTLDKQLNTITTPSQFTTTQQEVFNLLHHIAD